MSTPIYVDNPLKGLGEQMLQLSLARQKREAMEEDLKLRKDNLKFQQEEAAAKQQQDQLANAQTQGPQMAAQQMLSQMANQAAQPMMPMGMPVANGVANPLPQAVNDFQQMQKTATRDQALAAAPGLASAAQQEQRLGRILESMRKFLPPDEMNGMEIAIEAARMGLPENLYKSFIRPTAQDAAETLVKQEEAKSKKTLRESNEVAFKYLAEKGVNLGGPDGAQDMLAKMVLQQKAAAANRALTAYGHDRADARAAAERTVEAGKVATTMRKNWESSPVVQQAQAVAFSYGKIREAVANPVQGGINDQAIIYAFINMQDNTAARDAERKAMQDAGGLQNYIKTKFSTGRWKMGDVFTDEVRQRVVAAADGMLASQQATLGSYNEWTEKLAKDSGVDPSLIMYDPYKKTLEEVDNKINKDRIKRARMGR